MSARKTVTTALLTIGLLLTFAGSAQAYATRVTDHDTGRWWDCTQVDYKQWTCVDRYGYTLRLNCTEHQFVDYDEANNNFTWVTCQAIVTEKPLGGNEGGAGAAQIETEASMVRDRVYPQLPGWSDPPPRAAYVVNHEPAPSSGGC